MNAHQPSPTPRGQRGVVPAMPTPASAIVVAIFVLGSSACSSTKEIGPRGAARLYQLTEWDGVYYSIELPTVPLYRRGTYMLRVTDLEAPVGATLYLDVLGSHSGQTAGKTSFDPPAKGSASESSVIRVHLRNQSGDIDLTEIVGDSKAPWHFGGWRRSLHAEIRLENKQKTSFLDPGRDFTIRVEVLRPSEIPGRYLKISTCWNA